MTKKKPVSPEASGGAGTLFEYRVSAIVLTHLLGGTHLPGLLIPTARVAFQQRVMGHLLDDIIVYAGDDGEAVCIEYQVKRTLEVTTSDSEFVDVVTQVLHTLDEKGDAVSSGRLMLGLIARGNSAPLDQLGVLTRFAQAHLSHKTLEALFVPGVIADKVRYRLSQVQGAVNRAIANGAPNLGGSVDIATHAVLSALHVWHVEESEDQATLDRIAPTAASYGQEPIDLYGHFVALADNWGPYAGVVNAESIQRQLRRRGLRRLSTEGERAAESIEADAVVRGPMVSLGLDAAFNEANELLVQGDPTAAPKLREIAAQLEAKGFHPHAVLVRRREADALRAHGDNDAALRVQMALAWNLLDAARPWEAGFALRDARAESASSTRVLNATHAAVTVAKGSSPEQLETAFDALAEGDPHRDHAAAVLCETAVALAEPEVILSRLQTLEQLARGATRAAMRVQMCLGDTAGQWRQRMLDIHRRFDRSSMAWAQARYGRYLALTGDGAGAQEQYLMAIERACTEEMFDEAADWLYAWRTVRFWFHDFDADEQHPLAQALRPHARPSRLPGSVHAAEQALRSMQDEDKPAEAMQRARIWLWQSALRASLTEEIEAARAIGTLLRRSGIPDEAISWFVRAGEPKLAAATAGDLKGAPNFLNASELSPVDIHRTAAYATAAAAADLLSDEAAYAWTDCALAEINDRTSDAQAEHVMERAFEVLAATCARMPTSRRQALLDVVYPLIERAAGHYRLTDTSVARILITLTEKQPDAIAHVIQALLASERMANIVANASDLLISNKRIFADQLAEPAKSNHYAAIALIASGADPATVVPFAREHVAQFLRSWEKQSGRVTYHTGARLAAIMASILDPETRLIFAQTMLERSLDRRNPTMSRRDALFGLSNIADEIEEDARARLVPQLLQLAQGTWDGGPSDDIDAASMHPFSMFKLDSGSITMTDAALLAAARCATTALDHAAIERIGITLARGAGPSAQWTIAHALSLLPSASSQLDLTSLAAHPTSAMRSIAAVRWARNPQSLAIEHVVRLAGDEDHLVRRNLSEAIRDNYSTIPADQRSRIIGKLRDDIRWSIRRWWSKD